MKILLGSNNKKKLAELQQLFSEYPVELLTPSQLGIDIVPLEDGETYEENSFKKAYAFAKASSLPCIADDSGLEVFALGCRPGVYSSRYAGENTDDNTKMDKLLLELNGVSDRKARFVSVVSFVMPNGTAITARGECYGEILTEKRGSGGFGYDRIFYIDDEKKSFGEMTFEEKAKYSHRSIALKQLKSKLTTILEETDD